MTPIQLIVGLGNPGPQYEATRHNAGAWLVERLADIEGVPLKSEPKFFSRLGQLSLPDRRVWVARSTTFMNDSGKAVLAITQFYQIPLSAVLVVHDELDFSPGKNRFKEAGGHAGHNGLRDIIQRCGGNDFWRLRIGIGHPGNKNLVLNYVLHPPSLSDRKLMDESIELSLIALSLLLKNDPQGAMRCINSEND